RLLVGVIEPVVLAVHQAIPISDVICDILRRPLVFCINVVDAVLLGCNSARRRSWLAVNLDKASGAAVESVGIASAKTAAVALRKPRLVSHLFLIPNVAAHILLIALELIGSPPGPIMLSKLKAVTIAVFVAMAVYVQRPAVGALFGCDLRLRRHQALGKKSQSF